MPRRRWNAPGPDDWIGVDVVDGMPAVAELVGAERARQRELWNRQHDHGFGDCSSPHVSDWVKLGVLAEEFGEVARALLEGDREGLRRELVQVAAVATAWLETPQ